MSRLYLLYDSRCSLCLRLKDWVVAQPSWWIVTPIAAGSDEAKRRFPGVDPEELTVVGDDGRIWRGDHAWLMVLFALKRYRGWARRLMHPLLLPLARQAFAAISGMRTQECER